MNHAGDAGFVCPAPMIAGQRHRARCCAVIRAVAGDDLVTTGEVPRHLERVLICFRAAEREEKLFEITRHHVGEFFAKSGAHFTRHTWSGIHQLFGLLLNRLNHPLIAVTDVDAHQLRIEIEIALAMSIPKINALPFRHRDRVDRVLGRP